MELSLSSSSSSLGGGPGVRRAKKNPKNQKKIGNASVTGNFKLKLTPRGPRQFSPFSKCKERVALALALRDGFSYW